MFTILLAIIQELWPLALIFIVLTYLLGIFPALVIVIGTWFIIKKTPFR